MIKNEDLQGIIEYLQGSCKTLTEGIIAVTENDDLTEDDLTAEQMQTIEDEIFLCSVCGWWYEVGEMSEAEDENICIECNND